MNNLNKKFISYNKSCSHLKEKRNRSNMRFSTFASMAGVARLLAASTLFLIIRSTATAAKTFEDSSYSESYSFIHPEGEAAVAKVSPPPHPLPRWPATYNMSLSTIIMPCEYEKFITDPTIRKFGVVGKWCSMFCCLSSTPPLSFCCPLWV